MQLEIWLFVGHKFINPDDYPLLLLYFLLFLISGTRYFTLEPPGLYGLDDPALSFYFLKIVFYLSLNLIGQVFYIVRSAQGIHHFRHFGLARPDQWGLEGDADWLLRRYGECLI